MALALRVHHADFTHLRGRKYLLDIDVDNEATFQYCVAAALQSGGQKLESVDPDMYKETLMTFQQPSQEELDQEEDFTELFQLDNDLSYPLGVEPRHNTFVKHNAKTCKFSINVLILIDGTVQPLVIGLGNEGHNKDRQVIQLLQCETENDTFSRYLLIQDLDLFLMHYRRGKGEDKGLHGKRRYFCVRCLQPFYAQHTLDKHALHCVNKKVQIMLYPKDTVHADGTVTPPTLSFKNFYKKYPPKVYIVFDFESMLEKRDKACLTCVESQSARGARCRCPASDHSHTIDTQRHKAATFAYIIVDGCGRLLKERIGVSPEGKAGEKMVQEWLDDEEYFRKIIDHNAPMTMTEADQQVFEEATHCGICEQPFIDPETELPSHLGPKVRDHNHLDGSFLSAAHQQCNMLREQYQNKVVALAHNAFGYDVAFIMEAMNHPKANNIRILPRNTEKARAFSFNCFQIIDR